jgi:hypothetical protein
MAYTDIDKPDDYFNTVTYTGDGNSNRSVTGVGFQPDWTWIKRRNTTGNHPWFDVVRGPTNWLYCNLTQAQESESYTDNAAFISDGFKPDNAGSTNASGSTYVGWSWLADNTTGSSNTDGSITSTVSANTTSGFSIVTWTAPSSGSNTDTIGHGLSAVPKMIIARTRSAVDGWRVYHHVPGIDKHGALNNDNGFNSNTNIWPTLPTTSIFYPGSDASINSSSRTYVAYCFAEKKGFSKFGSYIGNGSSDGTFIYTGFKPGMIIIKKDGVEEWGIYDNKRDPFNVADHRLFPNLNDSESTTTDMLDFTSNGFKCRTSNNMVGANGGEYIYMAFAENPFVTSTGIPGLAR